MYFLFLLLVLNLLTSFFFWKLDLPYLLYRAGRPNLSRKVHGGPNSPVPDTAAEMHLVFSYIFSINIFNIDSGEQLLTKFHRIGSNINMTVPTFFWTSHEKTDAQKRRRNELTRVPAETHTVYLLPCEYCIHVLRRRTRVRINRLLIMHEVVFFSSSFHSVWFIYPWHYTVHIILVGYTYIHSILHIMLCLIFNTFFFST